MTQEQVIQAVRAALKSATGLPDGRVIVGNVPIAGAMRPTLPYLSVVVVGDGSVRYAPQPVESAITPTPSSPTANRWQVGWSDTRELSLSIQAHGTGGFALLQAAEILMRSPGSAVQKALDVAGCGVTRVAPVRDVSALIDVAIEPRSVLSLSLVYGIETAPAAVADIRSVVVDLSIERGGDVVYTAEIEIEPEE